MQNHHHATDMKRQTQYCRCLACGRVIASRVIRHYGLPLIYPKPHKSNNLPCDGQREEVIKTSEKKEQV